MTDPQNNDQNKRNIAGIGFLLLATTLFPLQDVIIKSLSGTLAVHQIVFFRGCFALPVVLFIAYFEGSLRNFHIGPFWLQFARAATSFSSHLLYYIALASIGIAETAAITFATPLVVTVLAVFFLSEKIGLPRWGAVLVGFFGVLVIVQPGSTVFEPAAVLALLAAVTYGASIIITRKIGDRSLGGASAVFTVIFFTIAGAVIGLIFHPLEITSAHPSLAFLNRAWVWPDPVHYLLFAALGLISGIGLFALIQAYRIAEASVVTPFEYTYLLWSVLWGYVFFSSLPGFTTWIGLALIIGSGLFIVYRETVQGRKMVRHKGLGVMRQR